MLKAPSIVTSKEVMMNGQKPSRKYILSLSNFKFSFNYTMREAMIVMLPRVLAAATIIFITKILNVQS